jgi:tetratricopeptide (TPR) repeat protein
MSVPAEPVSRRVRGRLATALLIGLAASASAAPTTSAPEPGYFSEGTEAAGLDFVHVNGMSGEYYLVEIMGPGAALLDYDGDGDLDVYLPQGRTLGPAAATADDRSPPTPGTPMGDRLLRNDLALANDGRGTQRFTDVTEAARVQSLAGCYSMGAATGDVDNDGRVDLYLTCFGPNRLLRNRGDGTFEDVTERAGVGDPAWSVSAAFFDYDRDGWLDLYVGNYLEQDLARHRPCRSPASALDYCHPLAFRAQPDRLYRNRGDGTFEDVSVRAGIASVTAGAALGVVVTDFDRNGWPDVYVANDSTTNFLWVNQGDGTFREDAVLNGTAVSQAGAPQASMGLAAGDFDLDGDEDLFATHLTGEYNTLYVNDGKGWFEDRSIALGLAGPSLPYTGFGTGWIDLENDGWPDLFVANGAVTVIRALSEANDPFPLHQTNQIFSNQGARGFVESTVRGGSPLALSEVSRGAAFGDVDNDGDTDILLANNNGRARLLLNAVGQHAHWLGLRVLDRRGRDALGARVEVRRRGGPTLWRSVRTDGSYASASDPRVLVGLGSEGAVEQVRVHWPDGAVETWRGLATDAYTTLRQGSGAAPPVALLPVPVPDLGGTEGRVREALEHGRDDLDAQIARDGGDPAALAEAFGATGILYHAHLVLEPAEICYRNAARLAPKDHRWPYYLAYLHQDRGRFVEAAEAYEQALALGPDLTTARLRLGQTYLELGRLDRAEEMLLGTVDSPGLEAAASFGLGRAASARQDYTRAAEWLERALRASPQATRVHYTLGLTYRALGDLDRARRHIEQRGEVEPSVPDPLIEALFALSTGQRLLFHAAMEAVYREDYASAARLFREGLALDPANADARVSLARALYLSGDRAGARAALGEARARQPDNALAAFLLGVLSDEAGDTEAAAAAYREALRAAPEHPGAHYHLADLLLRGGDYAGAAAHYRASLRGSPGNSHARLRLALALIGARASDREVVEVLEAVGDDPDLPEITYLLASLLAASPDESVRDGERAVALAERLIARSAAAEHAEVLAMAHAERGDFDRAVETATAAIGPALALGRSDLLARLAERSERFRAREPSRAPWPVEDLPLAIPPASAATVFRAYPADAPY